MDDKVFHIRVLASLEAIQASLSRLEDRLGTNPTDATPEPHPPAAESSPQASSSETAEKAPIKKNRTKKGAG